MKDTSDNIAFFILVLLCLLIFTAVANAKGKTQPEVLRVIDGDTIVLGTEHIRLVGYDAPELYSPKCDLEYKHAVAARNHLVKILRTPNLTIVRPKRFDKYGRTLGDALIGGESVAKIMIREGYGLPMAHRQHRPDWCEYLQNLA